MDLNAIPILHAVNERLKWLSAKQAVLSQNIANADTPGYRPSDLKEQDFAAVLERVRGAEPRPAAATGMRRTQAGHMTANGGAPGQTVVEKRQEEVLEVSPNGNGVVLEEQLMEMSNTQIEYNMLLNIYRKHMNMMRIALGRGGPR